MNSIIKNLFYATLLNAFWYPPFVLEAENDNSLVGNEYWGIGYDRATSDFLDFQHNLYSFKLSQNMTDNFNSLLTIGYGNAEWDQTFSSNTFSSELGLTFHESFDSDISFLSKIDPFVSASIGTFNLSGDGMINTDSFDYLPIATSFPWKLTLGVEFHFFDKLSVIPYYKLMDAFSVEMNTQHYFGLKASYFFIDKLGFCIGFMSNSNQDVFSTSILYDF
jgi:hypothetical protein